MVGCWGTDRQRIKTALGHHRPAAFAARCRYPSQSTLGAQTLAS